MPDLAPSNFVFKGRAQLRGIPSIGGKIEGLTYRPSTDTWFTIGKSGFAPFYLTEFKINTGSLTPTTISQVSVVRDWGAININDQLQTVGKAQVVMRGLRYNELRDSLVLNYCSYYGGGQNQPCLAEFSLQPGNSYRLSGPWQVDPLVSSEKAKGVIVESSRLFKDTFQQDSLCLTYQGNTSQAQPWGFGAVSVSTPDPSNPQMSYAPARVLSYWPMKLTTGTSIPYSDYPRDQSVQSDYLIKSPDGSVLAYSLHTHTPLDKLEGGCLVEGNVVMFGQLAKGHQWYGLPGDFQNYPSLLDPSQPTKSVYTANGRHTEAFEDTVWFIRESDIINKFKMADQKVSHYYTGRVRDLAGLSIPVPLQTPSFGQAYYDSAKKLLYVINHGTGNVAIPMIYVWSVQ